MLGGNAKRRQMHLDKPEQKAWHHPFMCVLSSSMHKQQETSFQLASCLSQDVMVPWGQWRLKIQRMTVNAAPMSPHSSAAHAFWNGFVY